MALAASFSVFGALLSSLRPSLYEGRSAVGYSKVLISEAFPGPGDQRSVQVSLGQLGTKLEATTYRVSWYVSADPTGQELPLKGRGVP